MSFYSYIFKPSDFIKGYCFNLSWMDECTHWWNTGKKWGPHSLKWPQPISLSFSNMFSNSVFYMQSKTAWWIWSFWQNVFYSSVSEETESCCCLPMTREWLLRLPAWGEKWDVTVSGGTEQRKLETRQKCVYSCQLVSWPSSRLPLPSVRRGELKGPFNKHKYFHSLLHWLPSYAACTFSYGLLEDPLGAERGTLPLMFIQNKTRSCLFKAETKMPKSTQLKTFKVKGKVMGSSEWKHWLMAVERLWCLLLHLKDRAAVAVSGAGQAGLTAVAGGPELRPHCKKLVLNKPTPLVWRLSVETT